MGSLFFCLPYHLQDQLPKMSGNLIISTMKIFVINGHKYYPFAEGKLNKTLFDGIVETLKQPNNEIKTTIVESGYNVEDEIQKFLWADVIIFQMPVNWFSLPGLFKTYIDEVYRYGVFYGGTENYGRGGLLKGKKYMYSLTWNSPKEEFGKVGGFYDGKSVDEVLMPMHKTQEFCALSKLPTFCAFDVIKNPDVQRYKLELREHLHKYI